MHCSHQLNCRCKSFATCMCVTQYCMGSTFNNNGDVAVAVCNTGMLWVFLLAGPSAYTTGPPFCSFAPSAFLVAVCFPLSPLIHGILTHLAGSSRPASSLVTGDHISVISVTVTKDNVRPHPGPPTVIPVLHAPRLTNDYSCAFCNVQRPGEPARMCPPLPQDIATSGSWQSWQTRLG